MAVLRLTGGGSGIGNPVREILESVNLPWNRKQRLTDAEDPSCLSTALDETSYRTQSTASRRSSSGPNPTEKRGVGFIRKNMFPLSASSRRRRAHPSLGKQRFISAVLPRMRRGLEKLIHEQDLGGSTGSVKSPGRNSLFPEASMISAATTVTVRFRPMSGHEQTGSPETSLLLEEVHCAACVWLIEKYLQRVEGVFGSEAEHCQPADACHLGPVPPPLFRHFPGA